ncbi:MAG: 2Fe-2S iron-sulfur cluster binding domain-containing protein [Planctomycetes bacterium]|nr:2Fe-2S iron-sulfur cluster binding domain-containing protein [Planctomycetota bacterium]
MPIVIVDGKEVEIDGQERLNGIQVAARAGVEIPHYCWHPGLSVVASCRMCLVETGKKDLQSGKITMIPKLVPACQTPASDGTVFVTESAAVKNARAMVEEDLLLRHPVDCPICDKAGECSLQDYHFQHGREERRADIKPFHSRRRSLGDTVTLFVDRCVMCTRCVRFCREVAGTRELMVAHRGAHEEIDIFPGFPLSNKLSGNVVDLCPVGALGDKDFLYRQRVWFMESHAHVCAGCSTGCSIDVDENQDRIYRLKPRENLAVNQYWMCDEGRYGWKHVHDPGRLAQPLRRRQGRAEIADWTALPAELDQRLRAAGGLTMVLSPFLTVEEALLAAKYARAVDAKARVILGAVPEGAGDERFSGGFTIRSEKCPNRRGVAQVIRGICGEAANWSDLLDSSPSSASGALWVAGGYKSDWIDASQAELLRAFPLLIVQDLFPSPLSECADYCLPAASFAEREGSYVNYNDRLQSFGWAIRPPAGVKTEARLFWQLSQREGMYRAETVRRELAEEFVYFSALSDAVPPDGIDLKLNRIAPQAAGATAEMGAIG